MEEVGEKVGNLQICEKEARREKLGVLSVTIPYGTME